VRKTLLTLALLALLAIPASGQFRFLPSDAAGLLGLKGVQDELKLSDDQKKVVKEASDELNKGRRAAMENKDLAAGLKAQAEYNKAVQKIIDKLDDKQVARLAQLEFQAASRVKNPRTFANPYVQKNLGFSADQKKKVKESIAELDKDFKEMDDEAKEDLTKFFTNLQKKQELNTETYEKITKTFDADQKKKLEKVGGDKFDFGSGFGFGKDKGKDKAKDGKKEKDKKDD